MEEEDARDTLEGQFFEFCRMKDNARSGYTIDLFRTDYWLRQSKILDDRNVTMTDTGVVWWKIRKLELNWVEWNEFITELCRYKNLDRRMVEEALTNCGKPGGIIVIVPQYRDFFDTYKPRQKLIY